MPSKNQVGRRASGLWKIAGAIWLGVFLILLAILIRHDSGRTFDSPLLRASLNTLFLCGIPLAVVCMATRSYRTTGSLTFLMMACGTLFLGVSNLVASWVMPAFGNPYSKITVFDLCCLFAGICHMASVFYLLTDLAGKYRPETRLRQMAAAYAGIVAFVCVLAALAVEGKLPVFFVPGA